jgi:hypothetical protein
MEGREQWTVTRSGKSVAEHIDYSSSSPWQDGRLNEVSIFLILGAGSVKSVILDLFRACLFVFSESCELGCKRYEQPPSEDG